MAKSDPLNGKLIVLFGGSGYLGNYVAQALLERGARLRIASRNPERGFSLKPLANLGQLQFARCDTTDRRNVEAVMQGADGAINLVGSFKGDLKTIIAGSAENIALAASEAGVGALVHVSAIAANKESPSGYAAAKGLSEEWLFSAYKKATVIRPPILFGEDDDFVNMFAGIIRMAPVVPVFAPNAPLQMMWVDDCAQAIVTALSDPGRHGGKIYEVAGPEKITMMEFNRRIAEAQGRSKTFLPMPDTLAGAFAAVPFTPMGTDQWLLLKGGNYPTGDFPGMKQLGLEAHPLGLFLDKWMTRYKKHGRFTGTSSRSV